MLKTSLKDSIQKFHKEQLISDVIALLINNIKKKIHLNKCTYTKNFLNISYTIFYTIIFKVRITR